MEELVGHCQEDARKRAERVGELRRKRFEAEFQIWFAELPEEKKKQIAGGMSPGSRAARAVFRSAFAEESGMELPTEG